MTQMILEVGRTIVKLGQEMLELAQTILEIAHLEIATNTKKLLCKKHC